MAKEQDVRRLLEFYPRIFFACHDSHRPVPELDKELTSRQASILDHLDSVRPTNLKDLARHMGVTPSTMSINVDRLVRLGLVRRDQAKVDRRQVDLLLTELGLKVQHGGEVLSATRVEELLDQLNPAEADRALEGLGLLAQAADSLIRARFSRGPTDEEEK